MQRLADLNGLLSVLFGAKFLHSFTEEQFVVVVDGDKLVTIKDIGYLVSEWVAQQHHISL